MRMDLENASKYRGWLWTIARIADQLDKNKLVPLAIESVVSTMLPTKRIENEA